MTFDSLGDLNWLAVIVAGIVYFALGALWYLPPVLGKPWMRATGFDASAQEGGQNTAMYIAPLATCLVASVATAMLAEATGTDTVGEGIVLGLIVGIGYAVSVSLVATIFDTHKKPQPGVAFAINAGYHLVGLLLAAVIISAWD